MATFLIQCYNRDTIDGLSHLDSSDEHACRKNRGVFFYPFNRSEFWQLNKVGNLLNETELALL